MLMKKIVSIAVLCALAFFGFVSCNQYEEETLPKDDGVRSVIFNAQLVETRTGLSLKFVPDWRKTRLENVHLFETENGDVIEGENVQMTVEEDRNYEVAHFSAEFSNMSVIVNPPSMGFTRADTDPFSYSAIVAQRVDGKYVLPSVQKPDSETLIDPDADFIVAAGTQKYAESQSEKQVDLNFVRPVSVSRLAIMNIEGSVVKRVKITSTDKLTGSAAYEDMDFEAGTVVFDPASGSEELTISFGGGVTNPVERTFYAYFLCLPGNKNIVSIEVTTDEYIYTKNIGKTLNFDLKDFKNIAVDMSKVTPVPNDEPELPVPEVYFYKDGGSVEEEVIVFSEDLVYDAPVLMGAPEGATVSYASSDEGVAIVSNEGVVTIVGAGEALITATVSPTETTAGAEASFTLSVTPAEQELSFTAEDLTVTVGQTGAGLTVSGVKTTVSYSSSDETVALVDAETGVLTPVAAGTATITASAVAGNGYAAASVTYALTVEEASSPESLIKFVKVTSEDQIVADGTYVIVYQEGSTAKALKFVLNSGKTAFSTGNDNAVDVTVVNDEIAAEEVEGCQFTLKNQSGTDKKFSLQVPQADGTTDYYFLVYMSNTNFAASASETGYRSTFAISSSGVLTLTGNSNRLLSYNTENNAFSAYTNPDSNNATSDLALFVLEDNRLSQEIFFSAEAAVYDLYTQAWTAAVPSLSGAQTTVTYESSDPAVATVAADGTVAIATTARKGDTAVVTATAAANGQYKSATAFYTITVVDETPVTMVTVQVEEATELVAGEKYILVSNGFALVRNEDAADAAAFSSSDLTVSVPSDLRANLEWTLGKNTDSNNRGNEYDFANGGYYFGVAMNTSQSPYEYSIAVNGEKSVASNTTIQNHNVDLDAGYVYYKGNSNSQFVYYDTATAAWTNYQASNGTFETAYSTKLYVVYRLPQPLSFSAEAAAYDLGTHAWTQPVPTLSGVQTTVSSYVSSDPTVATVAADGTVSPLAVGTTTITATAASDETYKQGTASYTVTVSNSNTPKYVKADEVVAGEQYLIVSNGYALQNNNSSTAGAAAVTVVDGEIEWDAPASALWTAAESSGKFTFTNDTRTLYRSSSNIQLSTSSSSTWSYDAGNEYLTTSGSSSTYYFYYSTNNSRFSASTSQSDTHVAALYKLDDGQPKAQNLFFSETEVTFNIASGATFTAPTLSGAKTSVSYDSTAPEVASVTDDGTVTIVAEGEATITAHAVATDRYLAGDASYTITVINRTQYYTKVNSRDALPGTTQTDATGDYIFVYEDGSKAHVFKAICEGEPTGSGTESSGHIELTKSGSAIEVALTENGILATAEVTACKLQLAHHATATRNDWNIKPASLGTLWIRINNSSSSGVRILAMTSAGYSATFTFAGEGNNLEVKRTDSGRDAYWSYNATADCFEATATASKISIYQLSE